MLSLAYVHAYNLHPHYLQPWTEVAEPLTPATWVQYFLANGLLRFRIPLLFAISGYLFAHRAGTAPHLARVWHRVRTLGVPFLAWSALGMGLAWALEQFPGTRQLVLAAGLDRFGPDAPLVSAYSPEQVLLCWLLVPVPFQLWFIRSLLVYSLCYPWLRAAVDRVPRLYFGLVALLWLTNWHLPVVPLLEGSGLLFFALGVWLRGRHFDALAVPGWFRPGRFLALWLALLVGKTSLAFYPQVLPAPALVLALLHKAAEAVGVLTLWFGADGLVRAAMRRAWFVWLTGFSFFLYAAQEPLLSYATQGALRWWPEWPLLVFGLLPAAVLAALVLAAALLRRVAPAPYGVLTGGRGPARPAATAGFSGPREAQREGGELNKRLPGAEVRKKNGASQLAQPGRKVRRPGR